MLIRRVYKREKENVGPLIVCDDTEEEEEETENVEQLRAQLLRSLAEKRQPGPTPLISEERIAPLVTQEQAASQLLEEHKTIGSLSEPSATQAAETLSVKFMQPDLPPVVGVVRSSVVANQRVGEGFGGDEKKMGAAVSELGGSRMVVMKGLTAAVEKMRGFNKAPVKFTVSILFLTIW